MEIPALQERALASSAQMLTLMRLCALPMTPSSSTMVRQAAPALVMAHLPGRVSKTCSRHHTNICTCAVQNGQTSLSLQELRVHLQLQRSCSQM